MHLKKTHIRLSDRWVVFEGLVRILSYVKFTRTSVGKVAKKNILKECVFVNSALEIQRHVVKNALLQTAFSAILPTRVYKDG